MTTAKSNEIRDKIEERIGQHPALYQLLHYFESELSQESKIAVEKDRESRWISVKERLPEKNEWVLVYIKCKNLRDEVTYETHTGKLQGTFWVIGGHFSFDIGEPLFWQPLPEAPKQLTP